MSAKPPNWALHGLAALQPDRPYVVPSSWLAPSPSPWVPTQVQSPLPRTRIRLPGSQPRQRGQVPPRPGAAFLSLAQEDDQSGRGTVRSVAPHHPVAHRGPVAPEGGGHPDRPDVVYQGPQDVERHLRLIRSHQPGGSAELEQGRGGGPAKALLCHGHILAQTTRSLNEKHEVDPPGHGKTHLIAFTFVAYAPVDGYVMGAGIPVPGARYPRPAARCQVPGSWCQVSRARSSASGTKFPVPSAGSRIQGA